MLKNIYIYIYIYIYMDIKGFYIRWLGNNYYLKDFKKVLTSFN